MNCSTMDISNKGVFYQIKNELRNDPDEHKSYADPHHWSQTKLLRRFAYILKITLGQKVSGRTVQITVGVQVGTWPCWSSLASVSPPTSGFGLAMSRARPCSGSFIFYLYKLHIKNGETGHHYLIL
jgi:hypothetical protein